MSRWLKAAKENLIPCSESKEFNSALSEWFFTGFVIGYGDEVECELCGCMLLKAHFEIENKKNKNTLLVGSSCIQRFGEISIFDDAGILVTGKNERKASLEKAYKNKIRETMLEPLRTLWRNRKLDRRFIEANAKQLKEGEGISPNALAMLFKLMREQRIEYKPNLYKVSLRSNLDQIELDSMPTPDKCLILQALSKQQIKRLNQGENHGPWG